MAPAARYAWPAAFCAHAAAVLWFLGGTLLGGRLLYFRDLSLQFAPDYAFAAASLRHGIWPLWNPLAHAGEPCLFAYPLDLLLLLGLGARAPLGPGAALHLFVALAGGTVLGRRLGMGPAGAWLAGTVYGLGGFLLSTVNLLPLFQAAAWAPWVIAATLAVGQRPSARRIVALAAVLALQISTLAADIVLQTALIAAVLAAGRALGRGRRLLALAGAMALAAALAAPAILGARALLAGTARERGFPAAEALAFSLHPVVAAEAALPRLLGSPHGFSDRDNWGGAYFPAGHPYLVSLYLGLAVLLLSSRAPRAPRLWSLAAAGVLLSLGSHGPLGLLPEGLRLPLRGPQKLFFLTHVALALLAGLGLERALRDRGRPGLRLLLVVPGAALVVSALAFVVFPVPMRGVVGSLVPPLLDPRGLVAAREVWPGAWLAAGALALGAGLALARGGRLALVAGTLAAVDLATVNVGINPLAPASFYELRPEVASLVRPVADARARLFSYGVAYSPDLAFEPVMGRAASDVWLFYLDRQALLPRTPALDGLESAFGVDRTGWSPPGSSLSVEEAVPARFAQCRARLEEASVRFVLSFRPLAPERVRKRAELKLPEVVAPLVLYELTDARPRASWEGEEAEGGDAVVEYDRADAHTVVLRARTPPGLLVVRDGYHPDWTAEDESGPVPLQRAHGRYRALRTPGGDRRFTLRYHPRWRGPALFLSAAGALAALALAFRR